MAKTSKRHEANKAKIDRNVRYELADAIDLLKGLSKKQSLMKLLKLRSSSALTRRNQIRWFAAHANFQTEAARVFEF